MQSFSTISPKLLDLLKYRDIGCENCGLKVNPFLLFTEKYKYVKHDVVRLDLQITSIEVSQKKFIFKFKCCNLK